MGEFGPDIGNLAGAFATISGQAVLDANARRLEIAEGNIIAATNQIELEETVQRRAVAQELAKFLGSQASARAFRGGAGAAGSGAAIEQAATAQAADQVAIIEANAANKEIAAIAANQVILDDPVLAAIEGGIQGLSIGTQLASALMQEAQINQTQRSMQIGQGGALNIPTFQNIITTSLDIPGFNLGDFFDLEDLFGGD